MHQIPQRPKAIQGLRALNLVAHSGTLIETLTERWTSYNLCRLGLMWLVQQAKGQFCYLQHLTILDSQKRMKFAKSVIKTVLR